MDSDQPPKKPEVKVKSEPTEAGVPAEKSTGKVTKGGAKKLSFAPKKPIKKLGLLTGTDDKRSIKKEEKPFVKREKYGERPNRGNASGRGRGRDNFALTASGPFSMGPAGINSGFGRAKGANPLGMTGGARGITGGGVGVNQMLNSRLVYSALDEDKEVYEDAEIMVHVEGGVTVQPESNINDIKRLDLDSKMESLTLSEDKPAHLLNFIDLMDHNDEENRTNLLFFQLPALLPELEMANQEVIQDEAKKDSVKVEGNGGEGSKSSPEPDSDQTPSTPKDSTSPTGLNGKVGKLVFYKSGKVKLRFGDILLDVNRASQCDFHQEIVAFSETEKKIVALGNIKDRFVCIPDIDDLLR